MRGVVLLDRLLYCDDVWIVFGSLRLITGLITGFHIVIIHLVRPKVLKVWQICSWGTFDKV